MKYLFLSFLFLVIGFCGLASGQSKYFKVLSFTVDGIPVEDYFVAFKVGKQEIIPIREGNQIFVPSVVSKAQILTIIFQVRGYRFEFDQVDLGYNEESDIQTDFEVGVDNKPFELEVSSNNKKLIKKYKTIYFLRRLPRIAKPGSAFLVEPSTFIIGEPK